MGVKISGEEGYQVFIGGGADQDQGLARELLTAIRFTDLPTRMESLFTVYTQRRDPEESFLSFTRRHQIAELQSFCSPQETA
jgi:ferredoxin-nitrite reductase